MAKLLVISAVILALAFVAAAEKQKFSYRNLFARRDPFPEPEFPPPTPANITLLRVTQRVDNFNPTNPDTWEQRYYQNNEFYQPGSPIFLFLAGEWAITPYRLTYSHMWTMAREFNANILYLEHRFYGESHPTPNVTDENLRLLSPEQALADTAHFINFIQSTLPGARDSEFILVGGHYSASLALWFRQRYPHLALGVWASSAPLSSIVNFDQFKVAVGDAYRTVGGDICYNALETGFTGMQAMIDAGNIVELGDIFYLCDDLETEDLAIFFSIMAEAYAVLPMFTNVDEMERACEFLVQSGGTVQSIARILDTIVPPGACLNIDYDYMIESDRQTNWNATSVVSGFRQWTYKMCTQIGWFHSSDDADDQPFGSNFPIDTYFEACEDVFGDNFAVDLLQRNSDRFNTFYGGFEPDVTNVVFVSGQLDPWSVIGRRTDLNDDAVAIVIPGGTMANDLGIITEYDPDALVAVKLQITEIIREWIDEADNIRK